MERGEILWVKGGFARISCSLCSFAREIYWNMKFCTWGKIFADEKEKVRNLGGEQDFEMLWEGARFFKMSTPFSSDTPLTPFPFDFTSSFSSSNPPSSSSPSSSSSPIEFSRPSSVFPLRTRVATGQCLGRWCFKSCLIAIMIVKMVRMIIIVVMYLWRRHTMPA